jgi:hypothetical protein
MLATCVCYNENIRNEAEEADDYTIHMGQDGATRVLGMGWKLLQLEKGLYLLAWKQSSRHAKD